jgi:CBS domain-containing protein
MKASDIMTRRVITVARGASILEAVRLMLQNRISGLPVVDDKGWLVGMVTEGDFLRRAETSTERRHSRWFEFLVGPGRLADEYVHAHARKVEEVMTSEPHTVTSDTPLDRVVDAMEKHHVKRLPVVDDGKLVGIISRANLLHALASLGRELPPATESDAVIRERLLAELADKPWSPARLNVVVRNGEVELSGVIVDERGREAIIVAAENVPGVKAIHDHLVWVEPATGVVIYSPEDEAAARSAAG